MVSILTLLLSIGVMDAVPVKLHTIMKLLGIYADWGIVNLSGYVTHVLVRWNLLYALVILLGQRHSFYIVEKLQ